MKNILKQKRWSACNHYATNEKGLCVRCGFNTLHLTNKELKNKENLKTYLTRREKQELKAKEKQSSFTPSWLK